MASAIEAAARKLAETFSNNQLTNSDEINAVIEAVREADKDPDGMKGQFRDAAKSVYESEGDLEFDSDAVVSISEDGGAYVACWKYIEL